MRLYKYMHMHHLHTHIHIRLHLYRQRVPQRYAAHAFKVDATDGSSHLLLQVMKNIIPARDPKQCQNKNNERSWYHGPIITHIAPHLSSVLGPDAAERRKKRELPRKHRTPKSTKITTENEHQFLGRMLQNTEKYENYHEKWTSVLGPDVCYQRVVDENYHTSHILHIFTHIHISTAHLNTSLSEDVFGPEGARSQNAERYTIRKLDISSWAGCFRKGRDSTDLNMFVIMSVKGSWYHGPEHLC